MWLYWLMFFVPALLALQERVNDGATYGSIVGVRIPPIWWVVMTTMTLLLGWRYEVGGDWHNYLKNFWEAFYLTHDIQWWLNDPGYRLLEWLSMQAEWDIYGVNLMGATIFSFGLGIFCLHLPRPWLALSVAVPYLVIILGMGYSRQGVALGCLMIGLVALADDRVLKFVFWAVLGATFHKSAVLVLPMAALAASKRRLFTGIWVAVVVVAAYLLLLADSVDTLNTTYLEAEYQSEGALIRLVMNVLPAMILLTRQKRFSVTLPQQRLWFWFSVVSILLLGAYFVSSSSTAVDRVALYLLPLQVMVFAYLPEALGQPNGKNVGWVMAVIAYYAAVEFVWLNFADHAFAWLPYRFYPFEIIF